MKCRDIERMKNYNIDKDMNYTIPKTITKMESIKRQLLDGNEYILDED